MFPMSLIPVVSSVSILKNGNTFGKQAGAVAPLWKYHKGVAAIQDTNVLTLPVVSAWNSIPMRKFVLCLPKVHQQLAEKYFTGKVNLIQQ